MRALEDLAAELRSEGGLVAGALRDQVAGDALPDGERQEMTAVLEAIREGYLLHYGEARLIDTADPDLALLAGDRLYALGLERLAAMGDLEAVRQLADVISDSARAHAEERPGLADQAWQEGIRKLHRASSE